MKLSLKAFIGLPVRCRSGAEFGRVSGADIDTETGRLQTIHAKAGGLMKGLMNGEALIDWSQVVEITDQAVVVEDSAVEKKASEDALRKAVMPSPSIAPMQSDASFEEGA
ncbi:MAG: PRC-barrel domain-containing protein [Patescibacteria group bacterium]